MPDRFSSRVRDCVRYRPDYAMEAIDLLARELPLRQDLTVADVGAGTGILTRRVAAEAMRTRRRSTAVPSAMLRR